METKLIAGVEPLADDVVVLAAIRKSKKPDPLGKSMHIALLGGDGNVYRTITTQGLDEYIRVCQSLGEIGFNHVPRMQGAPFDDVFVPGPPLSQPSTSRKRSSEKA